MRNGNSRNEMMKARSKKNDQKAVLEPWKNPCENENKVFNNAMEAVRQYLISIPPEDKHDALHGAAHAVSHFGPDCVVEETIVVMQHSHSPFLQHLGKSFAELRVEITAEHENDVEPEPEPELEANGLVK